VVAAVSGDLTADRRPFEAFWWLCKRLGLFWIARRLTRRRVRILCYHGFGTENEIGFRRGLFITPETFARRLDYVRSHHFSVVSLPDALRALDEGASRDGLTVITVDDVFFGFYQHAWPLLKRYGFPVTAYLTTYYARQPGPVFRLAIRFILWKTSAVKIDLSNVDERLHGVFDLTRASARDDAGSEIIALGESRPTEVERTALMHRTAAALGVDCAPLLQARTVDIVTLDEARELARNGVDLQLHTHRHRLPEEAHALKKEIDDNRAVLALITDGRFEHLCYPSGIWKESQWPAITAAGIASATTCDAGLNSAATPRLALKRLLDSEEVSQISFEAEMSGLKSLLRTLRTKVSVA